MGGVKSCHSPTTFTGYLNTFTFFTLSSSCFALRYMIGPWSSIHNSIILDAGRKRPEYHIRTASPTRTVQYLSLNSVLSRELSTTRYSTVCNSFISYHIWTDGPYNIGSDEYEILISIGPRSLFREILRRSSIVTSNSANRGGSSPPLHPHPHPLSTELSLSRRSSGHTTGFSFSANTN